MGEDERRTAARTAGASAGDVHEEFDLAIGVEVDRGIEVSRFTLRRQVVLSDHVPDVGGEYRRTRRRQHRQSRACHANGQENERMWETAGTGGNGTHRLFYRRP